MADILIDDVTNDTGTGIFDKLMSAVNAQIETQYLNNRITGSDYANVYLTSLQSVLQQSVQYVMQEQLTEAQIDGIAADNLLKSKQLEIAEQELAIKLYELQNMMPAQLSQMQAQTAEVTDSTVRANTQLNDQLLTSTKQRTLLDTQEEAEQYKVDFILPAELSSINKDVDVKERGMVEQEATGTKQRILLDTEEQAKQYEVDNLLPEQLLKVQEEIDLLQTQDLNALAQLKVIYADRVLKDKQAAKLGLDNVMKQSETSKTSDPNFVYIPNYEEV